MKTKLRLTKIVPIILLVTGTLFAINLSAQIEANKIYKVPGWGLGGAKLADEYIEALNETYYTQPAPDYYWYAQGGTIVSGQYSSTVNVKWDKEYAYQRYLTYFLKDGYFIVIYPKKQYTFSFGVSNFDTLVCSNYPFSLTSSFNITTTAPVYDYRNIIIYYKLERTDDGSYEITTIGSHSTAGHSVSGSYSFVPENHGITEGTYRLFAEGYRSGDSEPFVSVTKGTFLVEKAAPRITKNDMSIEELVTKKVNGTASTETTFRIDKFDYEGATYTRPGAFPSNNTFDFAIDYVPSFGIRNGTVANWDDLEVLETENNASGSGHEAVRIVFTDEGGNDCMYDEAFDIPQADITNHQKATCPSANDGWITISGATGESYKLYSCYFDSNGNIVADSTKLINSISYVSGSRTFTGCRSKDYIIRIEKAPFIIEKHIDLTAAPMQITGTEREAPTCYQGIDGTIEVTGLTYNGLTSLPTGISFYLDGTLTGHTIDGTSVLVHGTSGNHNLYFKVGTSCQSETLTNINIPAKAQNKISGQAAVSPLCHDGSDGKIQINAINFEGTNYNDATEYRSDGNSLTFNVYQNKTDVTPYKSVTPGDDFELPYTIEGLESRTSWYVSYTNNSVCASDTVAVTINNPVNADIYLALAPENPVTHLSSCIVDNGAIKVVPSGGYQTANISYHITGDNSLDQTFNNQTFVTRNFPNLMAGTYQIVVTDFCSETATLSGIVVNPAPRPIIDMDDISRTPSTCFNGLDGAFQINSFEYNSSVYNGSLVAGTETFSFRLAHGTSEQTVSPVSLPYIVDNCTGGDNWTIQIEETISGCLTADDLNFSILQPGKLVIDQNIIPAQCHDEGNTKLNALVSGGVDPYTYKWKDLTNDVDLPDNLPSIEVWEGTYELKIVDANNCGFGKIVPDGSSFTKTFTATRPQPLNIYIESATDVDSAGKANGTVVLGTTFNESFVFYSADGVNFGNNSLFTGLDAGVHTFYIRNGNLCTNSIDVTIGTASPFSANVSSVKNISCKGLFDGKVTLEASGGILPYTFEISGNGIQRTQSENLFENLPAGEYNLKASYTGVNTYTIDLRTIELSEPTKALSANITEYVNAVCREARGSATVKASGGTPAYSYLWGDLSDNQAAQTAENLTAGVHSVTVTDANGCTATATIELYDPAGPVLSQTGSTPVPCHYSTSGGSATLSVSGGEAPYDVYWPALNLHDSVAIDIAAGNYTAVVTDATNCSYTLSDIKVTAPSELLLTFDAFKDPSCNNDSDGEITASASGGTPPYQFEWPEISNAGNTGIVSGLASGVYQLNLNDDHSCVTTGSFELKNPEPIIINLNDSIFICAGQTATLDAGNPGSYYQWTSENGFSSDKQIVNLQEQGDYTLTISNIQGCSNSKKVHLKFENRQFDAGFLLASQATMTDTIVLIEISWPVPDSLEWFITDNFLHLVDGDAYKELIPLETGEYTIGMKAYLAGCEDIVEKTITILPADGQKDLKNEITDLIQSAKLFPNPNSGNFEVEINLAHENEVRADLFNMNGLRIIPTKYDSGKKDYLIDFNLMRLEPGVYFVNVAAGNEVRKLKFVVN
ncbi:MAG: T9SS type A sorting domain-containing protein [Bacteroidales bacterium]|nr:T9SS type A sorting domain-containing protein [Bacteroidales bacterium]